MPREPRTFRTIALILKRRDMGESDRLLTLLTPHHGKIEALAKGARKPTSAKSGHVELFTRADMLIAKGRSLDIITQAELEQAYLPLREDLLRGAYASYCAELLDRFTADSDVVSLPLFALLDETFSRLCLDEDVRRVTRFYELRLLELVGFRPSLQACVITQEVLLPEDQYFSFLEGGVVSPEGAHHATQLVELPLKTLKLLRHLQRTPYKQLSALKIDTPTHQDAERILLGYIRTILERKLQSVDFIRLLES